MAIMRIVNSYKNLASGMSQAGKSGARIISNQLLRVKIVPIAIVCILTYFLLIVLPSNNSLRKYACIGPAISPAEMTSDEYSDWQSGETPVIFNTHTPYILDNNNSNIFDYNLDQILSTKIGETKTEKVLILTPLRDAAKYLQKYFELLTQLTYPHELIDLGFIVSDCQDDTLSILTMELEQVQNGREPFRSASIVEKNFGSDVSMEVVDRHSFEAQAPRRKAMAKARNFLLYTTLKPDHSWVYWRDSDIVDSPSSMIEDMISHNKDVIVPNIWFHRYDKDNVDIEGRYDYNSWVESEEGLNLQKQLSYDDVIVEGYPKQYDTNRKYMAKMGDWREDKDFEIKLDGIGGVNIFVKADVHRAGINFPSCPFENQVETEGFGKMANRAGYSVIGLPNYVVWHIDTEEPSRDE